MSSSKKAKVAVIGCGGVSRFHFDVIQELQKREFLELVAVCDIVEARAREKGEKYHVPYFTDIEKMLRMDIDFVDILTGDFTHHTIAKIVAEHGKHMLIEKPMAISLPCCDMIINACRKAGVYYEVAENYFRTPTERTAKKIIDKGVIGDVLSTCAIDPAPIQSQASPFSSHSSIISLFDMGSHRMSEIRYFAGSDAKRVIGLTKRIATTEDHYDNWGHAVVEFSNGALGVCEIWPYGVWRRTKLEYREFVGTKGAIFITGGLAAGDIKLTICTEDSDKPLTVPVQKILSPMRSMDDQDVVESIIVKTKPEIIYKNPYADLPFREMYVSWADEIMCIARAALYDEPPEYGIEGRKDVEMCVAMYESSLKSAPVNLPIRSLTEFEKKVHEAYEKTFGRSPTSV